jgi:lipopolysaccharide/colanic/teichoic acid biosynthesis glycosyltransferase
MGEFAWIGNRPLSPRLANTLAREYERLWLAAPLGLISLADAEGCTDFLSAEMRAHSSYYAAKANWRLDAAILCRVLFDVAIGISSARFRNYVVQLFQIEETEERKVH